MNNNLIGSILKKSYKITKLIGKGGQCHVYLAIDLKKGDEVVIKELIRTSPDKLIQKQNVDMFKKEYELLHRFDHRGLPRAYEYFQEKDRHFLVVEYARGTNLKKFLHHLDRAFTEKEVISFGIQLAEVLLYLVNIKPHPVLIRDIKPANIMVSEKGDLKLIDFTIAREFDTAKEGDTVRIGSIGYAPPEQYKGNSDCRSDIYALGVTLYELLTKEDPSTKPFMFEPVRHINLEVSAEMETILNKALELNPELRYQRPEEILKDLSGLSKRNLKTPDYSELIKFIDLKDEEETKPAVKEKKLSLKWIIYLIIAIIILILALFIIRK